MSGFVSKFRHIWGDPAKPQESYSDIKGALTSGESQYVKANPTFLAYGGASGGAPVLIRKLTDVGRTGAKPFYVATHAGKLCDFDFHPFIDNMIATAADDCKLNINLFPKEGLTENVTKATQVCSGHKKKLSIVLFNPTANNIIASASYDRSVKLWNCENAACVASYDDCGDNIYSLAWNKDGSQLAVTGKDKQLRIFDPRKPEEAVVVDAFGGIKSSKVFFVDAFGWCGSTGFNKTAKRELKIWDLRKMDKTIFSQVLDQQASVLVPNVDQDLNVLYLAGKGDNSVTYYEMRNDDKVCNQLSLYRDSTPQKGGGWVPKRGLDVMKCEVQRYLKMTKDSIIPVSFIVPRKSGGDIFQEDIYPQTANGKPAVSADEWVAGQSGECATMSLDPDDRKDNGDDGDVGFNKKASYEEVVSDNAELRQKVKALETELAALKGQSGGGDDAPPADDPMDDPPADDPMDDDPAADE